MVSNETLLLRIIQLKADMLYWKKAHIKLQEQFIRYCESKRT